MTLPTPSARRSVRLALALLGPLALAGCGGSGDTIFGSSGGAFDPFGAANYAAAGQFGNTGAGALSGPYGLARDSQGDFYVTEIATGTSGRVLKYDKTGAYLAQFGATGTPATGQLTDPEQVAVDSSGNVYVADYANGQAGATSRVVKYDSTGAYKAQFGTTGTPATGQLTFPVGVAVDSAGDVFVTDVASGSGRVVEFDKSGSFLRLFGTSGTGALTAPEGVTLDSAGNVYVADFANGQAGATSRVVEYDSTGAYKAQFGATGTPATGQLASPQGVIVDPEGNVYVSDDVNDAVDKFGPGGGFRTRFDTTAPGGAQASDPLGLVQDGSGNVYVVDGGANSVAIFQPHSGAAPAALPRAAAPRAAPHHGRH